MNSVSVRGALAFGLRALLPASFPAIVKGLRGARLSPFPPVARIATREALVAARGLVFAMRLGAPVALVGLLERAAHSSNSASSSAGAASPGRAGRIRLALAGVQHADVEAVIGHDAPRGARRVVGRRRPARRARRASSRAAPGRNVTHGLRISMNEKPGWRIACAMISAVPFGSPEKARATKLAPDASAMTSGWKDAEAGAAGRELRIPVGLGRRRRLALGHAVDVVVHHDVGQVDIAPARVQEMVAADRIAVAVAAGDEHGEIRAARP